MPLKRGIAKSPSPATGMFLKPKTAETRLRARIGLLKAKTAAEPLSKVEQKMLEHELAIAEEIQANLLPKKIPQILGYELSAYYRPSHEVGGDYYDFIPIDEKHWGIVVADVSGKGIPGAFVMTGARAFIRGEAKRTLSPSETLIKVNRLLYDDLKRGMFVTVFYAVLSMDEDALTVSSAGHNPMVIWRKEANTCHLVNTNGLALGIDKGPIFERAIGEQKVQLFRNDRFVLYTDGATEAMNTLKQPLGAEAFYQAIRAYADYGSSELINLVVAELEKHQGKAPQHDDITLVTGRLLAPVLS